MLCKGFKAEATIQILQQVAFDLPLTPSRQPPLLSGLLVGGVRQKIDQPGRGSPSRLRVLLHQLTDGIEQFCRDHPL